ncbi:bifunctional ADP-dependent NAD(P)H-hydrate dehydratase/NAD(P)H-hydrate epimerase [Gayadomonas joobiniege]|uniref:bifunctional ADP-dependent NAD(P)H-hydrate dehydratase/NAD(P)H-hydrate epimerase n=1 Tax=Gayadomonas joobiniege TaxID=1234606 RepID=UPI0003681B15|nr:bifunctional ADP-dependent NAD(P)H-hydrate dehydratase/NAD(P)H-hydrate epimerase [Gayadomonas joobiniege]
MLLHSTQNLPERLFTAAQVAHAEKMMQQNNQVDLYQLMKKAAVALFEVICACQAPHKQLAILLGKGNNAGDGLAVAQLALMAGWRVTLLPMPGCANWQGAAGQAYADLSSGGQWANPNDADFSQFEIVLDAVCGIGFKYEFSDEWRDILKRVNQAATCVVSADIPSGLNANNGYAVTGTLKASHTVTFLAVKPGLLTGDAKDYVGQIHFAGLDVQDEVVRYNRSYFHRLDFNQLKQSIPARAANSHKGDFGRVLCIGGDKGMSGAIRLAALGALRAGAGTVTVLTHPDNYGLVAGGQPELMVLAANGLTPQVKKQIEQADCILIGPGLNTGGFANGLMQYICGLPQAKVVDADALNWLAANPQKQHNWILTPHPGEAGRLLKLTTARVQQSRFDVASEIQARYGGVCILKGAGSIVSNEYNSAICTLGNPGMAAGGMGDLLAGICIALLGQKFSLQRAAEIAVCVHAKAGDLAARKGQRGMIASDLLPFVRQLLNQAVDIE